MFTLLLIYFIPESPAWLIARGRNDEARKSLAYVRAITPNGTIEYCFSYFPVNFHSNASILFVELSSSASLNAEMERMQELIMSRNSSSKPDGLWASLKRPEVYKPLAILNSFFAFQQFSGSFVIIVYATQFAMEAGAGIDKFLCTVLIGLARVIATIILAYFILDKYGRKPPTIFSGIGEIISTNGCFVSSTKNFLFSGMTISMFVLSAYSAFGDHLPLASWMTTTFLLVYIITSTFGFLTIPFAMLPEMFPQRVRGLTAGITVCMAYLMSFIVIKSYPSMLSSMGNGTIFLFYGIVSLLGTFFVHLILPETKGKTLQEIENLFKARPSESSEKPQHARDVMLNRQQK